MNINGIAEITRKTVVKPGNSNWSGGARVSQDNAADNHCFYCNFSLKCGEKECIWSDDCV